MEELRKYVTEKDGKGRFGAQTLNLTISHSNLKQKWIEIRFFETETVGSMKERLYKHGGTPPSLQRLHLFDSQRNFLRELSVDNITLFAYGVKDDYEVEIIDLDPNSASKRGALEDVSLVEKYVMPDEEYDARPNTVRKFLQHKRMMAAQEQAEILPLDENIVVGKRCEVNPGGRRGVIMFVGLEPNELLFNGNSNDYWVGVKLDEPQGKNDGEVKGVRFFSCSPKHGVLVKAENVNANGDFPERGLESSDDEM